MVSLRHGNQGKFIFNFDLILFLTWHNLLFFFLKCSHFGYFNDKEEVVPLHRRKIYENDDIGLKTLEDSGRLKILTFPSVHHFGWHLNRTVIREAIIPYLD